MDEASAVTAAEHCVYVVFPAGLSLLKLVQRGVTARWSKSHFVSLAFEMLQPLAALREHGAAHRDIKPENTLLLPPSADPSRRVRAKRVEGASGALLRLGYAKGDARLAERLRVLLADWSTLRVMDDEEYSYRDPSDLPLLGTPGYQHFSFFTSPYLGLPWHPKQWDPSNVESRDSFAVGMTLAVCALGSYLGDAEPQPSSSVLRCVRRFVRSNAYFAGEAAREVAVCEVAAQWLHLHSFEQIDASRVLEGLSARDVAEFRWLCENSTVLFLKLCVCVCGGGCWYCFYYSPFVSFSFFFFFFFFSFFFFFFFFFFLLLLSLVL